MKLSLFSKSPPVILAGLLAFALPPIPASSQQSTQQKAQVTFSIKNDRSRSLVANARDFTPPEGTDAPEYVVPEMAIDTIGPDSTGSAVDSVVQSSAGKLATPIPELTFEGLSSDDNARIVGRRPIPPDTNGDVGPAHYVQSVNLIFAIYDKRGNRLLGPLPNNVLWAGFGGLCETRNAGDPIVLYDHLADRWLFSQLAGGSPPFHQCVAISVTGDPSGEWYRYDFPITSGLFNDYPKFGVWPDAYYMSAGPRGFPGPPSEVFAFEREQMLAGRPARRVSFVGLASLGYVAAMPCDLDGPPPPPGSANYFVGVKQSQSQALYLFQFHVDWSRPETSTFGIGGFPNATLDTVAPFKLICPSTRDCIPQPDTGIGLDALAGRYVMYRAQYRNFGGHESIVFNHTVKTNGDRAAVRWYEIRNPGGLPVIYQQSTYAPADGGHRWMASAAMDGQGNLALGFSVSSPTVYPSIFYAGRRAADPLGELTLGEVSMQPGSGSQLSTLNRWGDYSSMSVDPSDDCSFWYTTEYYAATSTTGWQTRVGRFRLGDCVGAAGPLQTARAAE